MAALVSWEYYSSLYSTVSEADFPKAEALAEKEVIRIVGLMMKSLFLNAFRKYSKPWFFAQGISDTFCTILYFLNAIRI